MPQTLTTQTGVTASGTAAVAVTHLELIRNAAFLLNVSAAAAGVGDTLDVYLQHSVDDGVTWDDFVHFTQVLGNGGAKKFLAFWSRDAQVPTTPLKAPQDAALAAGVQQGPVGATWRVKWVIAGGTSNFTFAVTLQSWDR